MQWSSVRLHTQFRFCLITHSITNEKHSETCGTNEHILAAPHPQCSTKQLTRQSKTVHVQKKSQYTQIQTKSKQSIHLHDDHKKVTSNNTAASNNQSNHRVFASLRGPKWILQHEDHRIAAQEHLRDETIASHWLGLKTAKIVKIFRRPHKKMTKTNCVMPSS